MVFWTSFTSTTTPRIGLALGSGSARGWAHIGVIDALTEAGIQPDIVCGTSIGALVGAAYVAGRLTDLRQWAEAATWREIIGLMDVRFSGGGLIDGKEVVKFLRRLEIGAPIESYANGLCCHRHRSRHRARDMAASPGQSMKRCARRSRCLRFSVRQRSTTNGLWTAGLSNPVPVSVCRALGANVIIAVNLNGDLLGRRFRGTARRLGSDLRRCLFRTNFLIGY